MTKPIRIAMFGAGTVGGGVYELVQNYHAKEMQIVRICVRSLDKPRDFEVDDSITTFTTNPDHILQDDSIDCIVEVMGGTGLAKRVVETALAGGKKVVTANKALLAEHSASIETIMKSTPSAQLAWEAAVCGGIPVIQLLQTAYPCSDSIESVCGICNGTTNFMLTAMAKGSDYATVLKEAQDLGYAEADPTADVEGFDVRAKIALLAMLAFGGRVTSVESIPCQGISKLTQKDFDNAKKLDASIKLIGTASRTEDGASIYVTPTMVHNSHPLASIDGVGNAVTVTSRNLGGCTFTGPGAGRYPTANSVVADLARTSTPPPLASAELSVSADYEVPFYVRFRGGSESVSTTAVSKGVQIKTLETDFATTEVISLSCVKSFSSEVDSQALYMPLLGF